MDPETEENCQFRYFFPSLGEPNSENGAFDDEAAFASALMKGSTPTLLFHPGSYNFQRDMPLTHLFPLQFPFGYGGIKENRPNKVSELECLKHYARLSSPEFRRGDFLLVTCHIYNRIKSFQSGFIKSKGKIQGDITLAERVSKLTEDDLKAAVTRKKLRFKPNNLNTGDVFLNAVSTSCIPVGHSNEAADFGRKKYMALWNLKGPPSAFFTFSPCDECSFRIKLYADNKSHKLPSLNWSEDDCILDLKLRKSMRQRYPGAGALEYQSIFQIILEKLLKWDPKKKEGSEGIAGIVEAWGLTTEEQGRLTLHGHMLLWIKWFNYFRQKLFSDDLKEKNEAISELKEYIIKVMSASYMGLEIEDHPSKNSPEIKCQGELKQCSDQDLRDLRHKTKSYKNKGIIAKCDICCETFSTGDILNYSLNKWKSMTNGKIPHNTSFPISDARKDVYAMRYPYEVTQRSSSNQIIFDKILDCIVKDRFNEHDFVHRGSCFKKGPECRFDLPKPKNDEWMVIFGDVKSKWYSVKGGYKEVTSFEVIPQRLMGDQFQNTFNPAVSGTFGYNTNIQIGDVAHIYYNTMYGSKSNQDEDTKDFIKVCNVISRRLAAQKEKEENEEDSAPEFIEGLSRVLIGIRAHISSYVIGAPLAYHLLTKGTRFEFSHEFSSILLGQLEDYTMDKELGFKIRQKKKKDGDVSTRWADCFTNNIIYRPKEIDNICVYQQLLEYEIKTFSKNKRIDDDDDDDKSDDENTEINCNEDNSDKVLKFEVGHPGRKFVGIKK